MTDPLVPCPSCARHVRAESEQSCPFCAAPLPRDLAALAVPSPTQRLSRAALVVFGASLALGATGCQREGTGSHSESIVQPYGAPLLPPDAQVAGRLPPVAIAQPYGVPPLETPASPDAGATQRQAGGVDAGARAADASTAAPEAGRRRVVRRRPPDDQGGTQPLYGISPKPTDD